MFHRAGLLALIFLSSTAVFALDIGFDGLVYVERSDNIKGVNSPDEESGTKAGALVGIFGEQRGRIIDAAFSGELDSRQVVSDSDSSLSTVSRFLGAAEIRLSPRSWRWYVGDILGDIRDDNAVQTIDNNDADRVNVFVTGPSFAYDVEGVSRTRARMLYVNQTEEDEAIESFYSANFSYERDTIPGSYFGFRVGDIYTDIPENSSRVSGDDFNRAFVTGYGTLRLGFTQLYGELGVTRYDTEDESLNGLNAELQVTQSLGPQSSLSARLTRNLNDQALSAVESLIGSEGGDVAVRPESSGIFADTRLSLTYSIQTNVTSLDIGAGISQLDYQLLASDANFNTDVEDHAQGFAFMALSNRISSRLQGEIGVSYQQLEYDNISDNTDSVLATAQLNYRLNPSFELQGTLIHDTATGLRTRVSSGAAVEEDIDFTENRVRIGLRWSPPTRASRRLTVELKSLLR